MAQYLDLALPADAVWTSVGHGVRLTIGQAVKLKAIGCKSGWPDIQILWRGQLITPELKVVGGYLRKDQKEMHRRITAAGGLATTCRSVGECAEYLDAMGIPLRARL